MRYNDLQTIILNKKNHLYDMLEEAIEEYKRKFDLKQISPTSFIINVSSLNDILSLTPEDYVLHEFKKELKNYINKHAFENLAESLKKWLKGRTNISLSFREELIKVIENWEKEG